MNGYFIQLTQQGYIPILLHCDFCIKYEEEIKHSGFINQFIVGSTNFHKLSIECDGKR